METGKASGSTSLFDGLSSPKDTRQRIRSIPTDRKSRHNRVFAVMRRRDFDAKRRGNRKRLAPLIAPLIASHSWL
jgi:hypothetical protein